MTGITAALEGRITQEPELKYTSTGKAVLNVNIGVLENRPNGDGAELTFVRVSIWEHDAVALAPRLKKGDSLYVEGRLSLHSWQNSEGETRTSLQVSAWKAEPLGLIGRRAERQPERVG